MNYRIVIEGTSPLIHHSGLGLDPATPINREKAEITRQKASDRTDADDARLRELECQTSLWLDAKFRPTIPSAAIRSNIEYASRKLRQGAQVREGLTMVSSEFHYSSAIAHKQTKGNLTPPRRGCGFGCLNLPAGQGPTCPFYSTR